MAFLTIKLLQRAVVVIKWSACSPSILAIRVRIPLSLQFLFCEIVSKGRKYAKRGREWPIFKKTYFSILIKTSFSYLNRARGWREWAVPWTLYPPPKRRSLWQWITWPRTAGRRFLKHAICLWPERIVLTCSSLIWCVSLRLALLQCSVNLSLLPTYLSVPCLTLPT